MEKNPHEINSNISINEKPINEGHDKSLHKHSNSITKAINFFHKSKGGESPIRKLNRNIKKTIRSLSPIRKDIYGTGKKDKNKHTKNVKRESSTYSNTKLSNDITNDLTGPTYSKCSSIGNNSNSNCRLSNDKMNEIVHYTNTEIDYSKTNNNTNKEFIDSYSNTNSGTTLNNINNQNNNYRNKLNRTSQQQPEFKIVDVISVHSNCSNENEVDNNFDYSYSQKDSQSNRNSNKAESDIHYNYYNHQNKEYSVSAHSTSSVDKLHSYSLVHDQSPRHYKKNSYNSYKDKRKYHNSYNSCHSNNSSLRYENWNYNKSQEFDDYGNIPDSVRNGDDYNYESLQEINRSNFNQDVIPETAEEYTTSDNNDYNTIITEKNSYIKNQNELPINNEPTKTIFENSNKRVSFESENQWNDTTFEINEPKEENEYIRHEVIKKNEILDALEQKLEMPSPLEEWEFGDGKCKRIYPNDIEIVLYRNGTTKEIYSEYYSVIRFTNGDIKEIMSDKTVYFYASSQTTQTTYNDGMEVYKFGNGQVETKYPDGTNEIIFPDNTVKYLYSNGEEESFFPDGTKQKINSNGNKIVEFSDGSKEITTKEYRQRIQQDGVTKTIYSNGIQVTQYPNGRVRIKDEKGNIIRDKVIAKKK
jgi:hypothetical protein